MQSKALHELLSLCVQYNSECFNVFFEVSFGRCKVTVIKGQWIPNKRPDLYKSFELGCDEVIEQVKLDLINLYSGV